MKSNTKIAPVIVAAMLACTAGSAAARDSVGALRSDMTTIQKSVAEINSQIQLIQLNQDLNIVEFAAYTANSRFDRYVIELIRVSEGCQVFVADERVQSAVTSSISASILMDPQEILDLAGVNPFFNQPAMIPLMVDCFSGDKGHVTGMLFRPQAIP